MASLAVQAFLDHNPGLSSRADGKPVGALVKESIYDMDDPQRVAEHLECRHIFPIRSWLPRTGTHDYFRAVALLYLMGRPHMLSRTGRLRVGGSVFDLMLLKSVTGVRVRFVEGAGSSSTVSASIAYEGDSEPVAFKKLKLNRDESAIFRSWFEHATPHPAEPGSTLPQGDGESIFDRG